MLNYQEEKALEGRGESVPFRMATVVSISALTATVRFDGEESSSGKAYKRIYGNTLVAGDRVLCARYGGTYIVLGALR